MIWELFGDINNYQKLALVYRERDWEIPVYSFNGTSLADKWRALDVHIEDNELPKGDFPSITGIPLIVTEKSYPALLPLIAKHVELLPLNCIDCDLKELYAVNVLTVLDCLDYAHSKIAYFSDGSIMNVEQLAFKLHSVGDTPIFKIPEHLLNRTFVNDSFKGLVEKYSLKGLTFVPVSNSTN